MFQRKHSQPPYKSHKKLQQIFQKHSKIITSKEHLKKKEIEISWTNRKVFCLPDLNGCLFLIIISYSFINMFKVDQNLPC